MGSSEVGSEAGKRILKFFFVCDILDISEER